MTAAKQYWVVDEDGNHALLTGAAERDRFLSEGWTAVDEPANDAFVYIWHEGFSTPGRAPMSALRALWGPREWRAGPPPGSPNPIEPTGVEATPAPNTTKSAANGDANTEGVTHG